MSENATAEAAVAPLTPENVREVFMETSKAFLNPYCGENEQQRLRETLLQILQNNEYRDVLATCVNEDDVIEAFTDAAAENDVNLLQAFHDIGMNVDATDKYGNTALKEACCTVHEESVRWLLDHGANAEVQDNIGFTPLMHASQNGSLPVIEMLLQKNANPDLQNKDGWTALMWASYNGQTEVVQLLLSHNVDIDLKNFNGKTALDFATNEEIKELLRNHMNTNYVLK